ncbi:alpha/beta fold hydrolase [Actinomycetospora sp. OC33-EN08]|uniref:Alpha/beta fold hydrolase n=1 Tax=Actinomycetospora aurantiaca TaxID=3129233 RepID=A0ABU8MMV4_9PSEU
MDEVRVVGRSGPAVLLLPGGAESADGFFPGLVEGLVADPGCRVLLHDRPGTGRATTTGRLDGAAEHLARVTRDHGPVVVVGQSLGGAVATLFARDHPELVAALVLLDPTPINAPRVCTRLERTMQALGVLCRVPVLHRLLARALRAQLARERRRLDLRPDCAEAHERISDADLPTLARSVEGLASLSRGFREADLPSPPAVVVTADRKPGHPIRQAHERLAAALGAQVVRWLGAGHDLHLDHPDETLAVVREVAATPLR